MIHGKYFGWDYIFDYDDIPSNGKRDIEHQRNLEEVLKRLLSNADVKLKNNKSVFTEAEVTAEGIIPIKANVRAT